LLTSPFGPRDPIDTPVGPTLPFHYGVDFWAVTAPNVRALDDGTVVVVRFAPVQGNYIYIRVNDGTLIGYYHLAETYVSEGAYVTKGQVIGLTGNTGAAAGGEQHLHLEIQFNGESVDPMPLLLAPEPLPQGRLVNADAISGIMDIVMSMNKVVAQQQGCFIEAITIQDALYREYTVRVKQ
jgi:murein DD-endopeptidase MepM/ murein hydrolase activator NlpD